MNIYESFAHALIQEHGRSVFLGGSHYHYTGLGNRMWRWLLLCYGKRIYDLPEEMSLPVPEAKRNALLESRFGFAAYTLSQSMRLGIRPTELYSYRTVGGYDHTFTPIHVGTALLKFGTEAERELALTLLTPKFLLDTYPNRDSSSFAQHSDTNPYTPEDFGLRALDTEAFGTTNGGLRAVDEIGNAAWFETIYVQQILSRVQASHWYGKLCELQGLHGRWSNLVASSARSLLYQKQTGGARVGHKNRIDYIRNVTASVAREYLKGQSGVQELLWMARSDVTPQEMARGLRVLATVETSTVNEAWGWIGRALTLEDFQELTSRHALTVLYHAPYESVTDVIKTRSEELSAMFFTLTSKEHLPMVSNSMSQHSGRPKTWYPDTIEGRYRARHLGTTEDIKKRWEDRMKPVVQDFINNCLWRDQFLQLAPPEVLLLALMRQKATPQDPVPMVAIDNVLRSYANIAEVWRALEEMPPGPAGDSAL